MNLEDQISDYVTSKLPGNADLMISAREELAVHLREEIENLQATGMNECAAFDQAVRKLGSTAPIKRWIWMQSIRQILAQRSFFYAVLTLLFTIAGILFPVTYSYTKPAHLEWTVPPATIDGGVPTFILLYPVSPGKLSIFLLAINILSTFTFAALTHRRSQKYLAKLIAAYSIPYIFYASCLIIYAIPHQRNTDLYSPTMGPGFYALVFAFVCPLLAVVSARKTKMNLRLSRKVVEAA